MTNVSTGDQHWMSQALQLAKQAESVGEVPVGAVIVYENKIIGSGWNHPISASDPTAHAEIIALRDASRHHQNYRLPGSTLYVTLEPCAMCAGAIVHARVQRVVFGALDPKAGAAGSIFNILQAEALNHKVELSAGILGKECGLILQDFFKKRRKLANN